MKFWNQKTTLTLSDGTDYTFHSKGESERYLYLAELAKQGKISDLKIQVKLPLYNTYEDRKKIGHYIADFVYTYNDKMIIEDYKSKSGVTQIFRLKQALIESYFKTKVYTVFTPRYMIENHD